MNKKKHTILLIEDDPGHAKLIINNLKNFSPINKIIHVSDGEEALNYLFNKNNSTEKENTIYPNIILLDLRLPKIDGLEVLRIIKEDKVLYKIPVIVLSTSDMENDIKKAYEYNANSYLVKPINFNKFMELLKDLSIYWLSWNIQNL